VFDRRLAMGRLQLAASLLPLDAALTQHVASVARATYAALATFAARIAKHSAPTRQFSQLPTHASQTLVPHSSQLRPYFSPKIWDPLIDFKQTEWKEKVAYPSKSPQKTE
jgi:hypothetical protein